MMNKRDLRGPCLITVLIVVTSIAVMMTITNVHALQWEYDGYKIRNLDAREYRTWYHYSEGALDGEARDVEEWPSGSSYSFSDTFSTSTDKLKIYIRNWEYYGISVYYEKWFLHN